MSPSPTRMQEWRQAVARVSARYQAAHGRPLPLYRPRRFTEKMQWRKLFDLDPIYATLSDKLAVRDYIAARIGPDLLLPLLWTGDDPNDLPFADLETPYVAKSTHGSGHVMIVGSRERLDIASARETMRSWLRQDFSKDTDEPGYGPVPRRLMVERQVFGPDGERPLERRLFVFNGRVRFINTVVVVDEKIRNGAFHTPDWQRRNWALRSPLMQRPFPPPQRLADLISAAERVAEGLEHVRADFFDCGNRIFIGEMTCYSWSGMAPFQDDDADLTLGSYWKIRSPMTRAALTMLLRERKIRPPRRPKSG